MSKMNQISVVVSNLRTICPKTVADEGMNALEKLCDILGIDSPSWYYNGMNSMVHVTPFFRAAKEAADEISFRLDHIGQVDIYPTDFWSEVLRLSRVFLDEIIA